MAARYGGHVMNVSATLAEIADSRTPAVLTALTKGGRAGPDGLIKKIRTAATGSPCPPPLIH